MTTTPNAITRTVFLGYICALIMWAFFMIAQYSARATAEYKIDHLGDRIICPHDQSREMGAIFYRVDAWIDEYYMHEEEVKDEYPYLRQIRIDDSLSNSSRSDENSDRSKRKFSEDSNKLTTGETTKTTIPTTTTTTTTTTIITTTTLSPAQIAAIKEEMRKRQEQKEKQQEELERFLSLKEKWAERYETRLEHYKRRNVWQVLIIFH